MNKIEGALYSRFGFVTWHQWISHERLMVFTCDGWLDGGGGETDGRRILVCRHILELRSLNEMDISIYKLCVSSAHIRCEHSDLRIYSDRHNMDVPYGATGINRPTVRVISFDIKIVGCTVKIHPMHTLCKQLKSRDKEAVCVEMGIVPRRFPNTAWVKQRNVKCGWIAMRNKKRAQSIHNKTQRWRIPMQAREWAELRNIAILPTNRSMLLTINIEIFQEEYGGRQWGFCMLNKHMWKMAVVECGCVCKEFKR